MHQPQQLQHLKQEMVVLFPCPSFAEVPQLHLYFCPELKIPSNVYGVTWITSVSRVFIVSSVTLCSAGALMTIISVPLHLCTLSPTPLLHPPHSAHKLQCLLLLDIHVSLTGNELQLPQATQGRFLTVIYP